MPTNKTITDTDRLNWLALQHVEVRTPLVYGSREMTPPFNESPNDDDGVQEIPWDIRGRIDVEMNKKHL